MSTNQSGLWNMGVGEREASLKAIEDAIAKRGGNPRQLFDRFRTDNSFTDKVAELMLRGGIEPSTDLRIVRAIMGNDRVFGHEDWIAFYGARLPKRIPAFPWSEEVLQGPCRFYQGKRVAETHFARLGLAKLNGRPLTIMKWHELHPHIGHPRFYFDTGLWYRSHTFATERTCEFRWYLDLVDIIPNSERKTLADQIRDCLPEEYEVPTAIAEVTKDVLYHRKRGQYPNPTRWGRTEDKTSDGRRVRVGSCDEAVVVGRWWEDFPHDGVGLAASRKSPST